MSTLQRPARRRSAVPGRSKGVVLIIALILLAVIGISSAWPFACPSSATS